MWTAMCWWWMAAGWGDKETIALKGLTGTVTVTASY